MAPSLLSRLMSPPRRLRQGRLLQHVAGIRFSDQGSGISLQQKAGRGRIGGGLRHRLHVARVRAIALFKRQARIARSKALRARLRERDHAADVVTQLALVERSCAIGSDVPADVGAEIEVPA